MPLTFVSSPLPESYGSQASSVNVFESSVENERVCLFLNGGQTLVAYLTPDEAFDVADHLQHAAAVVRRRTDPAHQIQSVLNEVFGTAALPIQGGVADRLAAAGYKVVKA